MAKKQERSIFTPARIIFYVLSLVVFYVAIHYLGRLKDIRGLLLQMSVGWLSLAVFAQFITYLFNVLILRTLLNGETGTTSLLTLFKLSLVIMFVNQALPSGGISGNGYIFNQLVKRDIPAPVAFKALILESICYYFAFLVMLGTCYGWYVYHRPPTIPLVAYTVMSGFVFFISLAIIMLIISNKRAISFVLQKLSNFSRIKRYITQTNLWALQEGNISTWQYLFENQKGIVLAVFFQTCILGCDVLTVFAIMQGFHITLAGNSIMLGLLLSLIIGSLPLSPGALIAYESAMTYFYTQLGVPVHAALIVTLLFRFFTFWLPIPLGLLLYRNLQRS
jgi:uncharacterized protein (TIRG00374 family)